VVLFCAVTGGASIVGDGVLAGAASDDATAVPDAGTATVASKRIPATSGVANRRPQHRPTEDRITTIYFYHPYKFASFALRSLLSDNHPGQIRTPDLPLPVDILLLSD
jgi:hypothetical protein